MKQSIRIAGCIALLLFWLSATGCAPGIVSRSTATVESELVTTLEPAATRSTAANQMSAESEMQTGIAEIDAVISAVLADDVTRQRELLVFRLVACTTADGLGGPPKCNEGEPDGTLVEVFPFLGPEGHFLRKEQLEEWPGIAADELYAAYRVSEGVFSDENYPAGEYAVMFRSSEDSAYVVAQIGNGGIVRFDYLFGQTPGDVLQRDAAEIILRP